MTTLGIIGAENSHSVRISEICNIQKAVPMRATHIWGETPQEACDSADKGSIPHIVDDWREIAGKVDGVMIDHRHAKYHAKVAAYFVERGIPTFVDKPFTSSTAEGKALLKLAAEKKTPLASFTAIPQQNHFKRFVRSLPDPSEIHSVNTTGPADILSRYGGIFFYGIHQVDTIVEILGTQAKTAFLQKSGMNAVATILFNRGQIGTVNCVAQNARFHWRVSSDKGIHTLNHRHDSSAYLNTAKHIHSLIRHGKVPWSPARMLAAVAILEALQKSLKSGHPESVAKV